MKWRERERGKHVRAQLTMVGCRASLKEDRTRSGTMCIRIDIAPYNGILEI